MYTPLNLSDFTLFALIMYRPPLEAGSRFQRIYRQSSGQVLGKMMGVDLILKWKSSRNGEIS
jgi:hypothetical protein